MVSNKTQHLPPLPVAHSPYTVYVVYFDFGLDGGGGAWTREKVRGTKVGRKHQHDWMYLKSLNSIEHQ
jgi:hypothetical protein